MVIGLQQGIFQSIGEDRTQEISEAMGALLRQVSPENRESFLRGPEMRGLMGIQSGMQRAAMGGGAGSGTLFRAMGLGSEGFGQDFFGTVKEMEKGIFGGEQGESLDRMSKILRQFEKESGGQQAGAFRMAQQFGMTFTAAERLMELLPKIEAARDQKGEVPPELQAELKAVEEGMKDPMENIAAHTARSAAMLAKAADKTLPAIEAINTAILAAQNAGNAGIMALAKALGLTEKDQKAVERSMYEKIKDATQGSGAVEEFFGMNKKKAVLSPADLAAGRDKKYEPRMTETQMASGQYDTSGINWKALEESNKANAQATLEAANATKENTAAQRERTAQTPPAPMPSVSANRQMRGR